MNFDIITVWAHKRLDDLLESEHTYYRLTAPDHIFGSEWLFYVLKREKTYTTMSPKYSIIRAYRKPTTIE